MRRGGEQRTVVDGRGPHSSCHGCFPLQFGGGAGTGRLGACVRGVQPVLARVVHSWPGAAVGPVDGPGALRDADVHHVLLLPGQCRAGSRPPLGDAVFWGRVG